MGLGRASGQRESNVPVPIHVHKSCFRSTFKKEWNRGLGLKRAADATGYNTDILSFGYDRQGSV